MELKDRIKHIRRDVLKLSQSDFAQRMGLSLQSVSYYETGRRNPSPAQCKLISQEAGVSYEWLTTGAEPMYLSESREEEIVNLVTRLLKDAPDGTKAAAVELILRYPDDEWTKLYEALSVLAGSMNR